MKSSVWPGLTVTIRSDGNDFTEYDVKTTNSGEPNCSGYVESCAGQTFSIEVEIESHYKFKLHDLEFQTHLDGKQVASQYSKASPATRSFSIEGRASADAHGQGSLQRFTFAKLVQTDERVTPNMEDQLRELGSLVVKIYRIRAEKVECTQPPEILEPLDNCAVPEKLLKGRALSNRAGLHASIERHDCNFVDVSYPWGETPVATFTFNYRARADLQIEGVIPRSPSPVPLDERDPASLTPNEALDLIQLLRRRNEQMSEANVAIKRERGDGENRGGRGASSIAEETEGRAGKRRRTSQALTALSTTIDLSED